jgi:hypothetical protein
MVICHLSPTLEKASQADMYHTAVVMEVDIYFQGKKVNLKT